VGGDDERELDVRVVAATNRELRAEVAAGRFREDLYFRLAVVPIEIPPLRARREDVLPLARQFLARANADLGRSVRGFGDGVERWLAEHDWPGNVRELENAIERGVVLARGELLELADVALESRPATVVEAAAATSAEEGGSLQDFVERAGAERIRSALTEAGGVKAEAARRLGIDRTTLYRLMRRYGVE
jgi:DNA-binding NtrC family response regulator